MPSINLTESLIVRNCTKKNKHFRVCFLCGVDRILFDWNTLESEILRYKMIFTSRGIPEFTQNGLNW